MEQEATLLESQDGVKGCTKAESDFLARLGIFCNEVAVSFDNSTTTSPKVAGDERQLEELTLSGREWVLVSVNNLADLNFRFPFSDLLGDGLDVSTCGGFFSL